MIILVLLLSNTYKLNFMIEAQANLELWPSGNIFKNLKNRARSKKVDPNPVRTLKKGGPWTLGKDRPSKKQTLDP